MSKENTTTYTQKEVLRIVTLLQRIFMDQFFGFWNVFPWERQDQEREYSIPSKGVTGMFNILHGNALTFLEAVISDKQQLEAAKSMFKSISHKVKDSYLQNVKTIMGYMGDYPSHKDTKLGGISQELQDLIWKDQKK